MQVVIYAYWSYFYFLEVVSVSAQLVSEMRILVRRRWVSLL